MLIVCTGKHNAASSMGHKFSDEMVEWLVSDCWLSDEFTRESEAKKDEVQTAACPSPRAPRRAAGPSPRRHLVGL